MFDSNNKIPNTGRFEISVLPQLKHKRQKRTALDLLHKDGPHQYAKLIQSCSLCISINT